ncbi:MAG: hypothetical protein IJE07_02895 [Clostridia bacterium]|nr:hypothetical protein [Clostridia bacterium]
MNVFQTARTVNPADVARMLGLKESQGRFCCPFHDDNHPSMACYADSRKFYCFACMARGDATDLWAKVTGLTPRMAAEAVCKAFDLKVTEDFVKMDPVRRNGSGPRQLPPEDPAEKARRLRTQEVAALPDMVLDDWRTAMLSLLTIEIDACEQLFEAFPDPAGWMWHMSIRRMTRLSDERHRLKAVPLTQLAAEAAERRADANGGLALPGQLEITAPLLRDVLNDRLRKKGMQLTAQERTWVCRTLQIPEEDVAVEAAPAQPCGA